jgi:hypothetical protein
VTRPVSGTLPGVRTRPLTLVALATPLLAIDFRVVAVDVLPDALGWLLVAVAAWQLHVPAAALLALVAAGAALAELHLPFRYDAFNPITGEVVTEVLPGRAYDERIAFVPLTGAGLVLAVVTVVAGVTALGLLLWALQGRATRVGADASARHLADAGVAVVGLWAVPTLAVVVVQRVSGDPVDPVWNGHLEVPALLGIAALLALGLLVAGNRNRRWAAPVDDDHTPWATLLTRRP